MVWIRFPYLISDFSIKLLSSSFLSVCIVLYNNLYIYFCLHWYTLKDSLKVTSRGKLIRDCFWKIWAICPEWDRQTAKMRSKKLNTEPRVVPRSPTPSSVVWSLAQNHREKYLITRSLLCNCDGFCRILHNQQTLTLTHSELKAIYSASIKDVATHHPVPPKANCRVRMPAAAACWAQSVIFWLFSGIQRHTVYCCKQSVNPMETVCEHREGDGCSAFPWS